MMLRVTCVIIFYYGNSYTHCRKSSVPSFLGCEETRRFYTETLSHTAAFTQTLLHTDHFAHRDWTREIAIFSSVFDVQRPFRSKGLRFVALWRRRPRLKREIERERDVDVDLQM